MKKWIRFHSFQIVLGFVFCVLIAACRPVSPTATPVALNGTATPPEETPAPAPTEIGVWPLSPDQHLMAAQTRDGAWWMWDAASRRPVYLLNDSPSHAARIHNPTFSADGRYLAAISTRHILLWEVAARKRHILLLPDGKDFRIMRWLVFSPDSHLLATSSCEKQSRHSGCEQGFVNLWNTADATLARTLPIGFRVDKMVYSADGSTLTVSGCSRADGEISNYCYERSHVLFDLITGERIALTRVPQFQ